MVQWVKEGLDSQFCQVDLRVWGPVYDLKLGSATHGRAIVYEDGSWETFRSYTSQYWELYNKICGSNEKIAVSTFWLGLLEDSELRDLLTRRPLEDMR